MSLDRVKDLKRGAHLGQVLSGKVVCSSSGRPSTTDLTKPDVIHLRLGTITPQHWSLSKAGPSDVIYYPLKFSSKKAVVEGTTQ